VDVREVYGLEMAIAMGRFVDLAHLMTVGENGMDECSEVYSQQSEVQARCPGGTEQCIGDVYRELR